MSTATCPLAVVGAGLAGTLLVRALADHGVTDLAWIGRHDPAAGSTVPCALVHPFAGRSFQPRPGLFAAWRTSREWLESLPPSCKVHRAPMHRVALEDPTGERLLRSLAQHGETLRRGFEGALTGPRIPTPASPTTLRYAPTFAVDLPAALRHSHQGLADRGLQPHAALVTRIEPNGAQWHVELDARPPLRVREVIVCAGPGARALLRPHTDTHALEHIEGRLVHALGAPLPHFTVDRGHLASTTDRRAWGSSFASQDRPGAADHVAQLRAIQARLAPHCAELPSLSNASVWAGVRVVDRQTRRPWIATAAPGLHTFTAFGSQGVLWIPWLAQRWARSWARRTTDPASLTARPHDR